MSGEVPEGWSTARLGEVATRIRRQHSEEPEHVLMISSTRGFVAQADMYDRFMAGESLKTYVELHRGEFAYNRGNSKAYPQGCIFRLDDWEKAAIPSVYISFSVDQGKLDSGFASQYFGAGELNDQLKRVITSGVRGNGLLNISADDFFDCRVPLPPLPEQKKIAAILSSVDAAIRATRAVIDQTRRVKEGLLQDLLTRGIGHTRFKQTELGELPESWQVLSLADTVDSDRPITYGIVQTGPEISDGVPCVRVVDMVHEHLDPAQMIRTTKAISESYRRTILREGDIMMALRGDIGQVRMVEVDLAGANLTRGVALIAPSKAFLPRFLLWALRSPMVRKDLLRRVNGSALQEIPLGNLRQVSVPLPPVNEQGEIAQHLDAVELAERRMGQVMLRQLDAKSGLLQDLLTGRVRVSP